MEVRLGDYVKIKTGKLDANARDENGIYPFFTCARAISRINKYAFDCECVLVAGNGELNVKYYEGKFNAYQRTYVIEVLDKNIISTKFLFYFLDKYVEKLREGSIGGVIKYIKLNHLTDIRFPLFDLETQNKIVAILDKANALIQKRQKTIDLLDELLVAQFLELFGDPSINKKHWPLQPLNDVLVGIDAGWSPVCEDKSRTTSDEWAVLKQGAVSRRKFNPNENKLLPAGTPIKKEVVAEKGDLLFSRKNSKNYLGSATYVFEKYEKLLLPDTIFNLRYDKHKVSGIYLYYLINDENYRLIILSLRTGAAGSMPNISQVNLLKHEIPIPPLELQNQFEKLVFSCNHKMNKFINSQMFLRHFFNSLIHRAFSGKLNLDISVELDALLEEIDLLNPENDLFSIITNEEYLLSLISRLNNQEFANQELYDKAKHAVFQLLKEEERIGQEYDNESKSLKIVVK